MNLIKLLALGHVVVALISCYYYFFSYNQQQLTVVNVTQSSSYDFFYFVQSWPGSFHPTPTKAPVNFAIHGLWAMYENGTYPKNCPPPEPFKLKKVATLLPKLNKEWASLSNRTNEAFWKYEWEKHGNCSTSTLDQYKYFNAALLLKDKTKILQILNDKGITPDGGHYSLRLIQKTIKDAVGYKPGIWCNTNGLDPTPELYEIYFCVDREGANFIECKNNTRNAKCGEEKNPQITFPIYKIHNLSFNDDESPSATSDLL